MNNSTHDNHKELFMLVWKILILLAFCMAGYYILLLKNPPTVQEILKRFSVGGFLMGGFVMMNIFNDYDLSTFLAVILILFSIAVFYWGLVEESDNNRKMAILTFAGTLFGFGSGLPIGKGLNKATQNNT